MLALVLAAALGQAALVPVDPGLGPIYSQPASMGGLAYFEAFRGAEAACTCSAVTGAKGEALAFARASTQTCTKTVGVEPQAIANGDLVSCASGQPAVMPGADGTSIAGLLVEGAATNSMGRSEDLDNAGWSSAITAGAVTVTANYAAAPNASPTYSAAERIQFSACPTVGTGSYRYNTASLALVAGAYATSIFCSGTSATQTISMCQFGTASGKCVPWTCPAAPAYTRIWMTQTHGVGLTNVVLGCQNDTTNYTGASNTGAADVLLWGHQTESGTVPTSYIPTQATTANRVATSAIFAVPTTGGVSADSFSAAITRVGDPDNASGIAFSAYLQAAGTIPTLGTNNGFGLSRDGTNSVRTYSQNAAGTLWTSAAAARTAATSVRVSGYATAVVGLSGFYGATALTPVTAPPMTGTYAPIAFAQIGGAGGGTSFVLPGVYKFLCIDQPSRCR